MGSSIKQKTSKNAVEKPQEVSKSNSDSEEIEQKFEDISQLSIPILPKSGLRVPEGCLTFPCGTFTEIQNAEFSHSPVIIKREKQNSSSDSKILKRELHVLTQIHHPNILLLMGIVKIDSKEIVTIFEDASVGSLHHLLHVKKTVLSSTEIQKYLTQLCHVMMFLHEQGWLHTAINSHNILISAYSTLKLTGFEQAQKIHTIPDENLGRKDMKQQWIHWLSPEQLEEETNIGVKSDIFSAGILTWEMCTNKEPWYSYNYNELLEKYKDLNCALEPKGLPSPFVNAQSDSFLHCMTFMLQIEPKRRISSFLEILPHVHKLHLKSPSTANLVSAHIQRGSLTRTHLLYQPQPQKAMLVTNKKLHLQDRDPYTGLKRVSNNGQKLIRKPSTTSLNKMNVRPLTNSIAERKLSSYHKSIKANDNKLETKSELFESNHSFCDTTQNNPIQQSHNSIAEINQILQKDISTSFESTQRSNEKPHVKATKRLLFLSDSQSNVMRSVPIKPASHLNHMSIDFKNNYTRSIPKEQNKQGSFECQKLNGRSIYLDQLNWETRGYSEQHCKKPFSSSKKECAQKKINTELNDTIGSSILPTENQCHQINPQNAKQRNKKGYHSEFISPNNLNDYSYHEENNCQLQKDHDTCNSDTESKENGFESTDSGIFTISREFDQNILNQMNSTEDLYIDDEFCLEMELDSHMQLLCSLDDSCEFNEHFIDDIQTDITEDSNIYENHLIK